MHRTLLDPFATLLSLVRAWQRIEDGLKASNTIMIEIDKKAKKIYFYTMAELEQEVVLSTDFCKLLDVDVWLSRNTSDTEMRVCAMSSNLDIKPWEQELVFQLVYRILSEQLARIGPLG